MKTTTLLGGMTTARFFREYWHKKPLLIRQAFPAMTAPVSRDALFALAGRDDVESRLIETSRKDWQVKNGPFNKLPAIDGKGWTLLVQGVNLHDDAADELLQRFRFVPDARLDDLMISYATDGGGVGPHFDSYDVFLLQAHGRRRWQISAQEDLSLVDDIPLKILKNFVADEEYLLEPGDMLYLPPHYAHDGVAVGECMTCSIGFRAPTWQELGESFLEFMLDTIELPGRYGDPDLKPTKHPAKLDTAMLQRIADEMEKVRFTSDDIRVFVGEHLSEPKINVTFDPPTDRLPQKRFLQTAARRGLMLSRKTRMLYSGRQLFINGESFTMSPADAPILRVLADERRLPGSSVSTAPADVLEALHQWHAAGWIEFSGGKA